MLAASPYMFILLVFGCVCFSYCHIFHIATLWNFRDWEYDGFQSVRVSEPVASSSCVGSELKLRNIRKCVTMEIALKCPGRMKMQHSPSEEMKSKQKPATYESSKQRIE